MAVLLLIDGTTMFFYFLIVKAELIDPMLSDSCNADEFSRYMHIGLLCVQEDASDRPAMSSVVLMLKSQNSFVPQP